MMRKKHLTKIFYPHLQQAKGSERFTSERRFVAS